MIGECWHLLWTQSERPNQAVSVDRDQRLTLEIFEREEVLEMDWDGSRMDNGRKLVEEELEMPGGDTKQWLSKLLEAPIMQATLQQAFQKLFRNNLLSLKKNVPRKVFPPLVQHITWILGPLSFKKQIHDGVDVNGNGWENHILVVNTWAFVLDDENCQFCRKRVRGNSGKRFQRNWQYWQCRQCWRIVI